MLSVVSGGCEDSPPGTDPSAAGGREITSGSLSENGMSAMRIDDEAAARILGLLQSGGFETAEAAAMARLEVDSEDARARFLLGVARQKQKRYAAGLAAIDEACASSIAFPERTHAGHFRGWCLFYLGRPEASAVAFRSHLEVMPDEADSHFGLGVALLETGEPEAALPAFESAIALNQAIPERRRDLAKALIRRGDAYWELDRIEDAQMSFQKGIVQFPDHYEGWAKLARAMDRLGDPVRAERARFEEQQARIRVGAPLGDPESDSELNSSKDLP